MGGKKRDKKSKVSHKINFKCDISFIFQVTIHIQKRRRRSGTGEAHNEAIRAGLNHELIFSLAKDSSSWCFPKMMTDNLLPSLL